MRKEKNKKIIVAMSGGLDSSVAAALLKGAGFDLVGVFMRLFSGSPRFSEKRAKKVADILGIPFQVWDLKKEFKKRVIDYFLKEYKAGRTPNPCVVCNKEIKFGLLLEKALALKADFIATGHYARKQATSNKKQETSYKLLRAKDKNKDQSYFLWQLNQKQLKHILFPIGDYSKKQVRDLAKKYDLPVLDIPESQEICFIQTTINDFLARYLKPKPGPVVKQALYGVKKIIGQHQGLHFYTIGQRKGIELASGPTFARLQRASADKPWYVLDKDVKRNILIITQNEKDLMKKELIAENVNWISNKAPKLPLKIKIKIRYKSLLASALIMEKIGEKTYKVSLTKNQRAITPGQSVVFYQGKKLLGGGIIKKSH